MKFKLNNKKKRELECVSFFALKNYNGFGRYDKYDNIFKCYKKGTDAICTIDKKNGISPEEAYFKYTSEGKHTFKVKSFEDMKKLFILIEAVRWRGIHIHEMYEQGVLEGSVPYAVLLEGMPESVIIYLSKEMFKSKDKEVIINIYNEQNANKKI